MYTQKMFTCVLNIWKNIHQNTNRTLVVPKRWDSRRPLTCLNFYNNLCSKEFGLSQKEAWPLSLPHRKKLLNPWNFPDDRSVSVIHSGPQGHMISSQTLKLSHLTWAINHAYEMMSQ